MTPRQRYIVMDLLDQSAGALPLLNQGSPWAYPKFPSWTVDIYPLGSICHKTYLYYNERVGRPYGYIYIVDHPSWTSIVPVEDPPIGVPQHEDIHGFIALNGDLVPHPAEYPDAPSNRLWFKSYRIAATNEA
ncbi:hypothetical protein EDB86DRAFT_2832524 [Lactarius hatsudake]|nr:hypothetical protein EDB86DRAFT_2832524 [Lactarius hatsudake]